MVEITSVGSLYLDVNSKSGYELTWNPSFSGQTHYEILYTFNKNDTWLTAGKVASTSATSYDLRKLYEIVDIDFVEIFYKVRVYYSRINSNGDLETGTEDSNIFSVIFNQGYSSELNVWNDEKKSFPMFANAKNDNIPFLSVNVDGTTERVPLVEKSSPIAGDLHIEVDNGERVLAKSSGYFAPNPIGANDSFGYFNVSGNYNYTFSEDVSYYYYRNTGTTTSRSNLHSSTYYYYSLSGYYNRYATQLQYRYTYYYYYYGRYNGYGWSSYYYQYVPPLYTQPYGDPRQWTTGYYYYVTYINTRDTKSQSTSYYKYYTAYLYYYYRNWYNSYWYSYSYYYYYYNSKNLGTYTNTGDRTAYYYYNYYTK